MEKRKGIFIYIDYKTPSFQSDYVTETVEAWKPSTSLKYFEYLVDHAYATNWTSETTIFFQIDYSVKILHKHFQPTAQ